MDGNLNNFEPLIMTRPTQYPYSVDGYWPNCARACSEISRESTKEEITIHISSILVVEISTGKRSKDGRNKFFFFLRFFEGSMMRRQEKFPFSWDCCGDNIYLCLIFLQYRFLSSLRVILSNYLNLTRPSNARPS